MSFPIDLTLEELFLRYWDNVLTEEEREELEERLTLDAQAREAFQLFCTQTVIAAELPARAGQTVRQRRNRPLPVKKAGTWSRRRALFYLAGGAAASLAAGVVGRWLWNSPPGGLARLMEVHGEVTLRSASGALLSLSGLIPAGAALSTFGPVSRAVLGYPDGTCVSLTGDCVVSVAGDGRMLWLSQGTALAEVPPQPEESNRLSLLTSEAKMNHLSGVLMMVGRTQQATEVGVQRGLVDVAAPSGEPMEVVREREILTVGWDGNHSKKPMPLTPDEFAWDLTRPLPKGWHIGHREITPDGPVVLPEPYFDPYHKAIMNQIRSDSQWACGFFRLFPESIIRVRYWIDQPGPSQVVVCVRTARTAGAETGVVERNDAFAEAKPGQWQWLEVKAGEMLASVHTPKFPAPWIGFLVIFNTYKEDLGLKVAEFRVSRPGQPRARTPGRLLSALDAR
jgi:ferric-dicitrate binding protein FerR (iron transport regulator)